MSDALRPSLRLPPPRELAGRVVSGDRRALARAITLIESTRPDHRETAEMLIEALLPKTGNSLRIGVSGAPGVGKSTFIEAFGAHIIEQGHRLAVLAVDPSSPLTGGSILGDKTRMEMLSRSPDAFIRPSPSGGTLGGVARRTREAMLACEAQGFDVILIETVGVGQSETTVANLADLFLLLMAPAAGDDLQGVKKGIVELAHLIVVNKADGDLAQAAERVRRDYANALGLLRPVEDFWTAPVATCSALTQAGVAEVWEICGDFQVKAEEVGAFQTRRGRQAKAWMWSEVQESLMQALHSREGAAEVMRFAEKSVASGSLSPSAAARRILEDFLSPRA